MSHDMVKFERGQIWVIRFKNIQEQLGHEQQKDRPWLILSIGQYNKSSGMITAVPITTRDYTVTPAQVAFTADKGRKNVILCEQIRSFDTNSGGYLFDYMGNVSDEILEKVDVAISVHLGLHYSPITLKKLHDSMEAVIKSVAYMEAKTNTPKFTDSDVLDFADKLMSLVVSEEVSASKEVEEVHTLVMSDIKPPKKYVKRYIRWTPSTIEKFLHDCDTMTVHEVMEKWDIATKNRFSSIKHYVKNLLESE